MSAVRKIGYSLLGLMAGDAVVLLYFLLMTRPWEPKLHLIDLFDFYLIVTGIFSISGWVLVGIPFVLVIRPEQITELRWFQVVLLGMIIGAFAQLFIFLWFGFTGHLNLAGHWNELGWYWGLAMLVSTIAFAVYCILVRKTLRQKKAAHPLGTPPA